MTLEKGSLLASHDNEHEPGVWFVFYKDDEGVVACDITREHPDIGYKSFESTLNFDDLKSETEKIVLLGGPERPDDSLIILHEAEASGADSLPLNSQFAMMPYTYIVKPGEKPVLTTPDDRPSSIRLKNAAEFLIVMGYRICYTKRLATGMAAGRWLGLRARPSVLFKSAPRGCRENLLNRDTPLQEVLHRESGVDAEQEV